MDCPQPALLGGPFFTLAGSPWGTTEEMLSHGSPKGKNTVGGLFSILSGDPWGNPHSGDASPQTTRNGRGPPKPA